MMVLMSYLFGNKLLYIGEIRQNLNLKNIWISFDSEISYRKSGTCIHVLSNILSKKDFYNMNWLAKLKTMTTVCTDQFKKYSEEFA
jgi:hypothetical protein